MGGCFRDISGKGLQSVYVQEKRYLSDGRLRITRKPLIDGKRKPPAPPIDKLGRNPIRSVGFAREPAVLQAESGGCLYLHFAGKAHATGRLKTCFQFSDDLLATSTLPVFKLS